jgi:hypothetical protein
MTERDDIKARSRNKAADQSTDVEVGRLGLFVKSQRLGSNAGVALYAAKRQTAPDTEPIGAVVGQRAARTDDRD